eukprot:TRINITY_DN38_c0_g2_i6.p1 TRINITY_DN38_c0_g2~~TRINITY_DN38_c0_g2_i6.p1  ORF type:complete len:330 (-),score=30.02 TRINITY_DN38_c0_g2_i6:189-1178(-)
MDSRSERLFVNKVEDRFKCSICHNVMGNPYDTTCGHTFCLPCITTAQEKSHTCSKCREPISLKTAKPSTFVFKSSLYSQQTYCDNRDVKSPENSCHWVGEWSSLRPHLNTCEFTPIACVFGCSSKIRPCDVKRHQLLECRNGNVNCKFCKTQIRKCNKDEHLELCPFFVLRCNCGGRIMRRDMNNHLASSCPETLIPCLFNPVGCSHYTERKKMAAHVQSAESQHMELVSRFATCEEKKVVSKMNDEINALRAQREAETIRLNRQMEEEAKQRSNEVSRLKIELLKEKERFSLLQRPRSRTLTDTTLSITALALVSLAAGLFKTKVSNF